MASKIKAEKLPEQDIISREPFPNSKKVYVKGTRKGRAYQTRDRPKTIFGFVIVPVVGIAAAVSDRGPVHIATVDSKGAADPTLEVPNQIPVRLQVGPIERR